MPKLPVISGNDLKKILLKTGFKKIRQKGSHVSLMKGEYKTVIPLHNELSCGTLLGILKQCGMSRHELIKLYKKK